MNSSSSDDVATVAIQKDGKVVVAGTTTASSGADTSSNFAVVRYTKSGELDATFGDGGRVITDLGFGPGSPELCPASRRLPDAQRLRRLPGGAIRTAFASVRGCP